MSEEIIETTQQEGTASTEDVKNVIPRERFNEVNSKLKEANNLIAQLQAKEKQYETYVPAENLQKHKRQQKQKQKQQ